MNDEIPRLTSTNLTSYHREHEGPTALLDSTATLYDGDNCVEHQLIAEIRLIINDFVDGEDILLNGTEQEIILLDSQVGFGSGSIFGSGSGELLAQSQYVTLTCDQTVSTECYDNLLRALHYNNTANEPTNSQHIITLEVSIISIHM